jgi:hypothetical protein
MDGGFASKGSSCELTAAIGDDFVYVHIELSAAARHPYVQRKHVVIEARQDFIAGGNDEVAGLPVQAAAFMIGEGGGFFQNGVGGYHFPGHKVGADTEIF